ncbi:MAG TPA: response regulator [Spirochaetota bacterium]|nr:response regulator [Spirochaetota bacterium]HPI90051.1 response regulator [Spirochaetota bacterium]HPR47838.1 response regulator [Spirochaetota bacterium]
MRKKLVFIIDDDPVIIMTAGAVLEAAGFNTASALNESEAINLINRFVPDCVLCDMMMESIDTGVTIIRALNHKHPHVPIFLMSSISDATEHNFKLDELDLAGFLKKPVDPETMIAAVQRSIEKNNH